MVDARDNWVDMDSACITAMRNQIQMEVDASYVYLAMGAYFSRDTVNMPGFAKMFFEHASEERHHAMELVKYLLMRGPADKFQLFTSKLIKTPTIAPINHTWTDGLHALNSALDKEMQVTASIKNVIKVCENVDDTADGMFQDYHLSDYLTGEFLEEQYKGQREIAGKIATLGKMMKSSKGLGLFLFDKELLSH